VLVDRSRPLSRAKVGSVGPLVVPINASNINAWLRPDRDGLASLSAILDDRERYYKHKLASHKLAS